MNGIEIKPLAKYALRHPGDVVVLSRAAWRLRTTKWWRHSPFLPLPDRAYWEFRRATALGTSSEKLSIEELVHAAKWSLRQRVGR